MNKNYLSLKKSLYRIVLFVLAGIACNINALAQTQLASLKHGDEISIFYGANALKEAHDVATTGDIITLSSGTFTIDSITKAITLRGAGIVSDTIAGTSPTIIPSSIIANIDGEESLTIEGILFYSNTFTAHRLKNPTFTKCYFNTFVCSSDATNPMTSSRFVNCRFGTLNLNSSESQNSVFYNCVIWSLNGEGTGMEVFNSYVKLNKENCTMNTYNSIICYYKVGNRYLGLSSQSSAIHCIGIHGGLGDAFKDNCWGYELCSEIFETFNGSPDNRITEPLILKEEIANTCVGMDGTEVGINGGANPYTNHPYYMTIRRCTVGDRTTNDGHLSVDIEVVTEE